MGKFEIYGLYCPFTGNLKYIGKANDSTKRLKSHLTDSKRRNTPVCVWIRELSKLGQLPVVKVLCQTSDWKSEEKRIIQQHRNNGANLLNVAIGGNEPFCSNETRVKNARKVANEIHSNPNKKRLWHLKTSLANCLAVLIKMGRHETVNSVLSKLNNSKVCLS